MATFPAAGYLSNNARTEGEMKAAFEDLLAAAKQIPGAGVAEAELTISSGSVTPTSGLGIFSVDTEADAAADDLTNIAQSNHPDGSLLLIRCVTAARVVTVKASAGGSGQVATRTGADVVLDDPKKWMLLKRTGALWEELFTFQYPLPAVAAKGDLLVATAASVLARLARGADGAVLTADQDAAAGLAYYPPALWGTARLTRAGGTTIQLGPGMIPLKVGNTWRLRALPSPITKDNSGLAANTTYLVYARDSGGSTVLEILEAGANPHAPDATTGVEIKSGDATRTLVGMVRTNASIQFDSTPLILSWYGRRLAANSAAFAANRSTSSTSYVELSPSERVGFLTWADQVVDISVQGSVQPTTAIQLDASTAVGIDGTTPLEAFAKDTTPEGRFASCALRVTALLAEGYHYATILGRVAQGTGQWIGGATPGDRTTIRVVVMG